MFFFSHLNLQNNIKRFQKLREEGVQAGQQRDKR